MEIEKYQWSKEDTLKLIRLYKGFPYLWNSSLPDHRDKDKRAKAMVKIAKDFKTSVSEIQRKLHNLRCSFNQEIRRLKNKNYFSSWEYFDSMYFVAGQYKRRSLIPSTSNLELRSFKTEEAGNSRNSIDEEIPSNEIPHGKKRTFDMMRENGCSLNKICHITKQDDDFQTFGNFVGVELRSITCPFKREDLKRMILQNILTVTDISYVSPSLNFSNSRANQNSPSLHSMISVESGNDAAPNNGFSNFNDHEFHINNVKLEK